MRIIGAIKRQFLDMVTHVFDNSNVLQEIFAINTWRTVICSLGHGRKHMLRLQLHGAIYRPDSFVLMPRYCANLKAIRYESTNLNRIVADKSHRVIVALRSFRLFGDQAFSNSTIMC